MLSKAQYKLIAALVSRNIGVRMVRADVDRSVIWYQVGGFYKSGEVTLIPIGPCGGEAPVLFVAHARYGEKTPITSLSDLVELNCDWFSRLCDKRYGCGVWLDLLVEHGLVTVRHELIATVRSA